MSNEITERTLMNGRLTWIPAPDLVRGKLFAGMTRALTHLSLNQ